MDTNLLATLVQLLAAKQQVAPTGQSSVLIVGMIIAALAPTVPALAGWLSARSAKASAEAAKVSSDVASANTAELKKTAIDTAAEVVKVHNTVNSERTAMVEKLEESQAVILEMAKRLAALEEYQRSGIQDPIDRGVKVPPPHKP